MHRTTIFAHKKRAAIFEVLGPKCAACGVKDDLEFDLIVPQEMPKSHHEAMSFAQRMIFYCRQLSSGNLQVLCSKCNSRKFRGTTRFIAPLVSGSRSHRLLKQNPF